MAGFVSKLSHNLFDVLDISISFQLLQMKRGYINVLPKEYCHSHPATVCFMVSSWRC